MKIINRIVLKENYEKDKLHIKRLLKMVFGATTEIKKKIIRKTNPADEACENDMNRPAVNDDTLKNDKNYSFTLCIITLIDKTTDFSCTKILT